MILRKYSGSFGMLRSPRWHLPMCKRCHGPHLRQCGAPEGGYLRFGELVFIVQGLGTLATTRSCVRYEALRPGMVQLQCRSQQRKIQENRFCRLVGYYWSKCLDVLHLPPTTTCSSIDTVSRTINREYNDFIWFIRILYGL